MLENSQSVYLFFAPPRVGNHFVELLIAGLYPISPVFLFHADGHPRDDLVERYGTASIEEILKTHGQPVVPPVSEENPTLFIEYEQPVSEEVVSRGNEVDLEQIRKIVGSNEASHDVQPLTVQWFHDDYHANPYRPHSLPGVDIRYLFVVRSPQAMAFSHFRIIQDRWQCYADSEEQAQERFDHFYTHDLLEKYFAYLEESKAYSESEKAFVFRYESLVRGFESLERFCSEFVGYPPKLAPARVHAMASIDRLQKRGTDPTFYREGQTMGWLKHLDRRTLNHMMKVESVFDFSSIGYPSTREVLHGWPAFLGGRLIHLLTQKPVVI